MRCTTDAELVHEVNGVEIDRFTHSYNTQVGPVVLGADLDRSPYVQMQVAAVLMYDRALSEAEQAELESYLDSRYAVSGASGPSTQSDQVTLFPGESVAIDVLGNDSSAVGLDSGSVVLSTAPANGTAIVDEASGEIVYTHDGAGADDVFAYTVSDQLGRISAPTQVSVLVGNPVPQVEDDAGLVAVVGGSVVVDVLANDTDESDALDASSVTVVSAPQSGLASVDPQTGEITYEHDGGTAVSDSFTYTVADAAGGVSAEATVSIGIAGNDPSPVAQDDAITLSSGGSASIDVLANDTDNAELNAASVVIVQSPLNGVATVDGVTGVITYTHDGITANDEFSYTVMDTFGQVSNEARVQISNLPGAGLVMHFEADALVSSDAQGAVLAVQDRSGRGNDLSGVGDVSVLPDALNGRAVFDFDGDGDALVREAAFNGLPVGSGARTVYQVVRYESAGSGGFGYGQPGIEPCVRSACAGSRRAASNQWVWWGE